MNYVVIPVSEAGISFRLYVRCASVKQLIVIRHFAHSLAVVMLKLPYSWQQVFNGLNIRGHASDGCRFTLPLISLVTKGC